MSTATQERQSIAELAKEQDWQRREGSDGCQDSYYRGTVRIRTVWAGDDLSGASLFHDEMYESYTRQTATLRAWFKR